MNVLKTNSIKFDVKEDAKLTLSLIESYANQIKINEILSVKENKKLSFSER